MCPPSRIRRCLRTGTIPRIVSKARDLPTKTATHQPSPYVFLPVVVVASFLLHRLQSPQSEHALPERVFENSEPCELGTQNFLRPRTLNRVCVHRTSVGLDERFGEPTRRESFPNEDGLPRQFRIHGVTEDDEDNERVPCSGPENDARVPPVSFCINHITSRTRA